MAALIRLFVSSTFRDMHAERDHLNRLAFPELRARCLRRGVEFSAIDLRWGITADQIEARGTLPLSADREGLEVAIPTLKS